MIIGAQLKPILNVNVANARESSIDYDRHGSWNEPGEGQRYIL